MRVIDSDTHITSTGEGLYVDQLLAMMDSSGVDKSVVWLQPPYMRTIDALNKYVYQATKDHPDRFFGFGWADPHFGRDHAVDSVKRCIEEYGMYGVKLNGAQNSYYIDDEEMAMPVIEQIATRGKILALHVGADFYQFTHPYMVGKIAERFPELRIIMIHMGGTGIPDLSRAAIETTAKHKNIMIFASNIAPQAVLQAISTLGSERVCFGSDAPFGLMHVELAKFRALLDGDSGITDVDKENFFHGNVERFLQVV